MIFKILGGALVFVSCTLLGLYYSFRDGFRISDLAELRKALVILKSEMEFSSTLSQALTVAAERVSKSVSKFFTIAAGKLSGKEGESAADIWRDAITQGLNGSYLLEEDLKCLERLGETLGGLGKRTQSEAVDAAISYIDEKTSQVRESEAKNKRLYRNVGIAGGLLITIFFL